MRLHNTSQLAGFAKADDLAYFLKKIGGIEYVHQPLLAPTDPMLKAYKKEKGDWRAYEECFLGLMSERHIEDRFKPEMFDGACLFVRRRSRIIATAASCANTSMKSGTGHLKCGIYKVEPSSGAAAH